MRHIISLLLENEAGALSRVAGLFSARGYNIESLSVAATEDPTLSRMTIVTTGSDAVIEQIYKQLNKLIDVVKVVDLTDGPHLERELMLVKFKVSNEARAELARLTERFSLRLIDLSETTFTVEVTDISSRLDEFFDGIDRELILETVRSGAMGIPRGSRILKL